MDGAWIYILECRDGALYVGSTRKALEARMSEHDFGLHDGFTKARRPVKLVWSQHFPNITDAIAVERQIKGWRREKKLALITGDLAALPTLSRTARQAHPSTGSG